MSFSKLSILALAFVAFYLPQSASAEKVCGVLQLSNLNGPACVEGKCVADNMRLHEVASCKKLADFELSFAKAEMNFIDFDFLETPVCVELTQGKDGVSKASFSSISRMGYKGTYCVPSTSSHAIDPEYRVAE